MRWAVIGQRLRKRERLRLDLIHQGANSFVVKRQESKHEAEQRDTQRPGVSIVRTVGLPGAGLGAEEVIRARSIADKAVPARFGRRIIRLLHGDRSRIAREAASTAEVGNPNSTVLRE